MPAGRPTEVHWNFNTCPLCKDEGKRVILMLKKCSDATQPCGRCGTRFKGYILPDETITE